MLDILLAIDVLTATLYAAIALAFATAVLAVGTIYYALQTKDLVIETRKTREYEILPIIKASFSYIGPIYVALKLDNVGRGNAIDIDAKIHFEPTSIMAEREWKERVLVAGSHRDFMLRDYGHIDKLALYISTITVTGKFKDTLGVIHSFEEKIGTQEFVTNIQASEMRLLESVEDYLKDISKNTESIGSKIDSLSSKVSEIKETLSTNQTPTTEKGQQSG